MPAIPDCSDVVALDIGGTKLAAGRVSSDGRLTRRHSVATPADGTAEQMWDAVVRLLEPLCATPLGVTGGEPPRPAAIGIGCGGPMSAGGVTVSPLNITAWREFPLAQRLRDHFGLAVALDNDAKALARAEGAWGAARGCDDYIAMVVSTGVGGGVVVDGRLVDGASGNAGHIGHMIVEPHGRACRCGAFGCLEAEVSGTAIRQITGRSAIDASSEMRQRCGRLVGRAVGSVANLLDLRLAVIAGSVALGFGDEFFDAAQDELDHTALLEFSRGVRVVPGGCGDEGPLLGAAAVAFDLLGNRRDDTTAAAPRV